ncbi:MAG: class I SAM-dependent methyltransferase [Cyanobacteria bacterium P01_H01_bin.105]
MKKTNYYNAIAPIYDQTRWMTESVAEDITDFILTLVNATPSTSFLEPGVGTGLNILPLVKRGYPVTGIDISPEMLDQFRQKLQQIPKNLTLMQSDASTLPLPDASVDVVLTVHMIHTVADWPTFLDEIDRVLKPQGCYLNAQWTTPPVRKTFESHFKTILLKYPETRTPKRVDNLIEEIDDYFHHKHYQSNYQIAKEWTVTNTVGELLSYYKSRAYGFCWWAPDDIFHRAMAEFEAFCVDHYGSFETELSSIAKFEIWAYTASRYAAIE